MSRSVRVCTGVSPATPGLISEFLETICKNLKNYPEFVDVNQRPIVGFSESSWHELATGEVVEIKGEPIYMTPDEHAEFLRESKMTGKLVGEFIAKGQRKANGQSLAVSAWGNNGQDIIAEVGVYEGHAGYDPMISVKFFWRDSQGIVRHKTNEGELVKRPCGCVQKVRDFFGHFSDSSPEAVIDYLWSLLADPEYYGVMASGGGKAVADQHQADPNYRTSNHHQSRPDDSHWRDLGWGSSNRPF